MKNLKIFAALLIVAASTSCASRYRKVDPQQIVYNSLDADSGVTLEYKYDVLKKKYRSKELKKKIKIISVKINNNSGRDLTIGQDVTLTFQSGRNIGILENKEIYKALKQHPATHLLYLLLTPLNGYATTNSYSEQEPTAVPIGVVIGPGLTLGNMLTASGANKKFRKELDANFINGKVIKNGETLYGLVGIHADGYDPLKIKVQQ